MKYILITILLFTFNNAFAQNTFSPTDCEFEVDFPVSYYEKISMNADGKHILAATAKPNNKISLLAECWPYSNKITLIEFADALRKHAISGGINVLGVLIDDNGEFPIIILTGNIAAQSQKIHVKALRYIGTSSEMGLVIVEEEEEEEEQGRNFGLSFRNSVRKKK